jgi:uncharacterized protein YndB with AHSA1/START domain
MPDTITVSRVIPARAERIFTAWLDAAEHARMTGSPASAGPDGQFTAWEGSISGRTVGSTPFTRIVQSWRSKEFPEGAPDSTLTVTLEEQASGTLVTLHHSNIPEGQGDEFADGWGEWYFDPMTTYFGSTGSRLKDVGEALEDAVEKTGEAVEQALEEAGEQLQATAQEVKKAVTKAGASARKQAVKAVKAVKKVQKQASQRAGKVGKRVQTLLRRTKKAAPAKKKKAASGKKKAVARKPAPRKAAPKKKPARRGRR